MSLNSFVRGGLVAAGMISIAIILAPVAQAFHLSDPTRCTCSAYLSLPRPSLQWGSGGLTLIPRADVTVYGRGGSQAPPLNVAVTYDGSSSYTSSDVSVPAGISFNGTKPVLSGASCNGSYRFRGLELTRVTLPGVTSTLLGDGQELLGKVKLSAAIQGCGADQERRQLTWRMTEFGNLWLGLWGSVR